MRETRSSGSVRGAACKGCSYLDLVIGIAALFFIYGEGLNYPIIRSDGEAYYAYLPAVFIYHDVTLRRTIAGPLDGVPPNGTVLWVGTTRYLSKTPYGEAFLMSPFFFIAWGAAYVLHFGMNGYSPPFHYAMAFSGLFYTVMGLLALWTVLQNYFKPKTILIVLTALLFGTNLFHYATYDATFSHTYSFFLFSLFLLFVERFYRKGKVLDCAAMGISAGLIVVTRNANILWLLFGVFYGIVSIQDIPQRIHFWKLHWKKILLALVALVLVVIPQLIYWRMITRSFFVFSYPGETFNLAKPEVLNVLFSVRKGLFFWSPILLTIFPGLYFVRQKAKEYFLPILIFFPIDVYVISSWWSWWYGGSFGQRPFAEAIPMFAIALCCLYEGVESTRWKKVLVVVIILASAYTIWMMLKYWFGIVPFDGLTWEHFVKTFFTLSMPQR